LNCGRRGQRTSPPVSKTMEAQRKREGDFSPSLDLFKPANRLKLADYGWFVVTPLLR
jgi:hypothetical protein